MVRRHVLGPDKERVAHSLPYLEILKEWLKDSIFIGQHKMMHKMLSSLLVNHKRTIQSVLEDTLEKVCKNRTKIETWKQRIVN